MAVSALELHTRRVIHRAVGGNRPQPASPNRLDSEGDISVVAKDSDVNRVGCPDAIDRETVTRLDNNVGGTDGPSDRQGGDGQAHPGSGC